MKQKTQRVFNFLLLTILVLLSSCSSNKVLVQGLDQKEATEIVVYLLGKGIESDKTAVEVKGGGGAGGEAKFDIYVRPEDYERALTLLRDGGYPKSRGETLLSIFSKGGLVPSDLEEQIRYQAGLAETLAHTIRKIDGVLEASVQLAFPKEDPLNPEKNLENVKASVYVKHSGVLDDPNSQLIPRIRRLVSSGVQGLKYDNVTVIPDRARFSESSPMGSAEFAQPELVRIWSVAVSKGSASTFRIIFFTFSFITLFLLLVLVWLSWKFYPIMRSLGSFKAFFDIHPINLERLNSVADKGKTPVDKIDSAANEKKEEVKEEEGVT